MRENLSGAFDYERQRFDEEQEILRADPAYLEWLEYIAASAASENKRKELNHGDHGK